MQIYKTQIKESETEIRTYLSHDESHKLFSTTISHTTQEIDGNTYTIPLERYDGDVDKYIDNFIDSKGSMFKESTDIYCYYNSSFINVIALDVEITKEENV